VPSCVVVSEAFRPRLFVPITVHDTRNAACDTAAYEFTLNITFPNSFVYFESFSSVPYVSCAGAAFDELGNIIVMLTCQVASEPNRAAVGAPEVVIVFDGVDTSPDVGVTLHQYAAPSAVLCEASFDATSAVLVHSFTC